MTSTEQILSFGPFELHRSRKLLLENGVPVRLGSRALELLVALVERAGEVVGKNELIACVWPDTFVEENNLRVHITAIRKRLGDGQGGTRYILNVAGRGYSFVGQVRRSQRSDSAPTNSLPSGNLPAPIARPLGRADLVDAIALLLSKQRLVTLIGPGGVGKSTVAISAAEKFVEELQGQVWFVDLSVVSHPSELPATIATVLNMSAASEDPMGGIVANLRNRTALLLFDNCEHVVSEVGDLIKRTLRDAVGVRFLVTSREPLLAEGEQTVVIPPLGLPESVEGLTAASALASPAVQLFVERAGTVGEGFQLTDRTVERVVSLCRQLDGIPLAIEIVAARAGLVGLAMQGLEESPSPLLGVQGRRTAGGRHSSLRATLDWSYRDLSMQERAALERLSVFRGHFSVDAAVAVVGLDEGPSASLEAIVSLMGKSLLNTDVSGPEVRYRLLNLTRTYALEHLIAKGDSRAALARHATHFCEFLETAVHEYVTLTRSDWLALHRSTIDDVRAAMDWSFSSQGDERLGARLTVAAVTFGFQLSLIDEFKVRIERALGAVRRLDPPDADLDVRLTLALANLRIRTADAEEELRPSIERVVMLTRESGEPKSVIWPLTNRTLVPLDFGDYAAAMANYADLEAVTRQQDDPFATLTADRVGAMACHWAGDHARARRLAERAIRHPAQTIPLVYSQFSVDRRVSMRVVLARILWLQGLADQAQNLAMEAVNLAAGDSPNAVCDALGHAAVPIALWRGDWTVADRLSARLLEHTQRFTLTRWHFAALCFRTIWSLEHESGISDLELSEELARATPLPGLQRDLMATLSTRWIDSTTLSRGRQELGGWCSAELLRVSALQNIEAPGSHLDVDVALHRAMSIARQQGAVSWELRAAFSLARLWQQQDRRLDALQLLSPIYERFGEGLGTRDLLAARELLLEMQR